MSQEQVAKLGLPPRPFLYTRDQIAALFSVTPDYFNERYCWYQDRSVGKHYKDLLRCINIAPQGAPPDWRINEPELKRFLKFKKFRYHERTWHVRSIEDEEGDDIV